ncbi:branched-chain amino acid transport system substrate-binding protein [Pseudovibrio ascidiaceicola]|uniref:Branched-chain amino acid transport system substrate-binding protein n=1 Tax=Pseudovibrio ascidiaceicola TaxID=285279 RepID=A0A1I4FTG1_9HYPH|nr:ABC transporter substrate-binding protein [Pseudovibrio ascidiaceicola]SFL21138.1 branched-chain amino acid transport system substrate-binding protein [Pseudovibrio ascidiaceicola]
MNKTLLMLTTAACITFAGSAWAEDIKVGALMGVTGPLANFIPPILNGAKLAEADVNKGGGLLDGQTMKLVVADSQASAQPSVDAAGKLVNIENVVAIMGALSSGATIAAANAVAIPNGVLQVSPTATAPSMTNLEDNDYVYRIVPSDNYQGKVLARAVLEEGFKKVAITYVNNDYGVGIGNTFKVEYEKLGGVVTKFSKHEDKKNSYRGELATLASSGADALVVIAYAAGSGAKIVKQSLENGFFEKFIGTDGLRDDILIQQIGAEALASSFFTSPSSPSSNEATEAFHARFDETFGGGSDKPFVDQAYDATMLIALAIQQAGSTDRTAVKNALRSVANAPGEIVGPGEWAKARELISAGKDINYEGVSGAHEFDANGDVAGYIGKYIVEGDSYKQTKIFN